MMETKIVIPKSRHRDFIVFCVNIVNELRKGVDPVQLVSLFNIAESKGLFKAAGVGRRYLPHYAGTLAFFLERVVCHLAENDINEVTVQRKLVMKAGSNLKSCSDSPVQYTDTAVSITHKDGASFNVARCCPFGAAFINAAVEYIELREICVDALPLRYCEYCGCLFFGRVNQRFCSRLHGQKWHSRENYKKKKAANLKKTGEQ